MGSTREIGIKATPEKRTDLFLSFSLFSLDISSFNFYCKEIHFTCLKGERENKNKKIRNRRRREKKKIVNGLFRNNENYICHYGFCCHKLLFRRKCRVSRFHCTQQFEANYQQRFGRIGKLRR